MRVAKVLWVTLLGVALLGMAMPSSARADDDDKANEPQMVGGSYSTEVLRSNRRSEEADLVNEPTTTDERDGTAPLLAEARGDEDVDVPSLPEEFRDAAFERYVDLHLVGEALATRNASLLADVALQLAEGERVLLRKHASGLTARKLMGKAAQLAGDKQDKATIERLIKAAEASGDKDFVADLRAAEKLAAAGRTIDPALTVPVETTDVETFAQLKRWLDAVDEAVVLGDKVVLKDLRGTIDETEGLSDEHKKAVVARLDHAIEAAGDPDAEDDVVRMLASASRSPAAELLYRGTAR